MLAVKAGRYSEIAYKSKEYLALPIVYKKIVIDEYNVFTHSQEGVVEKHEKKQLLARGNAKKGSLVEKKQSETLTEVELFEGFSLKKGDIIERYEKFFVVRKIIEKNWDTKITEYFYYTLDGKFIGKSGGLEVGGDYEGMFVPNFLMTDNWLALGGDGYESVFGRYYTSN